MLHTYFSPRSMLDRVLTRVGGVIMGVVGIGGTKVHAYRIRKLPQNPVWHCKLFLSIILSVQKLIRTIVEKLGVWWRYFLHVAYENQHANSFNFSLLMHCKDENFCSIFSLWSACQRWQCQIYFYVKGVWPKIEVFTVVVFGKVMTTPILSRPKLKFKQL